MAITGETGSELYKKDTGALLPLPVTPEQIKDLEKYVEEIESTNEELKAGKIGAKEAIRRLREISEKIPG